MSTRQAPDRNIAMELVRVTEAGAMAAARWIGHGKKESADQAAVDAMRYVCLLYTSPSPRDRQKSRMPSSA